MLEQMWELGEHSTLLVGVQTCAATLKISIAVSQKLGNQSASRLNDTVLGIYPKDALIYQDTCSTMFIAALFIISEMGNKLDAPQPNNG